MLAMYKTTLDQYFLFAATTVQGRKSWGTGGMVPPPKVSSGGDRVSYIPQKFDLLGITLLAEVSVLDLRVAAMKSTQST